MIYTSRHLRQSKQVKGNMDNVEAECLEGRKREKDLEKRKDDKFGKPLSGKLEWRRASGRGQRN